LSGPEERSLTIVHGSLAVGGIEQLLVRFAEELHGRGWRVQFVLQSAVDNALHRRAASLGPVYRLPVDYRLAWPLLHRYAIRPTAHLFGPTSNGLLLSHLLRQQPRFRQARITAGVYFPLEYGNRAVHDLHEIGLAVRLIQAAPDQNMLFMNDACRDATANALDRSFAEAHLVPVPVVIPLSSAPRPRPVGQRLVSVGRLVQFKGYTFGALSALRALADEGRRFHYDVYGDGPMRPALESAVVAAGLEEQVTLHGEVPPEHFADVCGDALAFLGMGTAAVEAAALGVPTLLASVGESGPHVHGWFSEARGFDVGESPAAGPLAPMTDLLRHLDDAGPAVYGDLSVAGRARAERFALPTAAQSFEDALLAARPHEGRLRFRDLLSGLRSGLIDLRSGAGSQRARRAARYERD